MTSATGLGRRRAAALTFVALGIAAMFIASFGYRLNNPSLIKSVAGSTGEGPESRERGNMGSRMGAGLSGENMERISALMSRLRDNPDDFDTRLELAYIFMDAGDSASSATHLSRAVSLRPDSAEAQYSLGIALHDQGRFEESARAFERVLELGEDFSAMFNLAVLYHRELGQSGKAAELLRRVAAAGGAPPDLRSRAGELLDSLK